MKIEQVHCLPKSKPMLTTPTHFLFNTRKKNAGKERAITSHAVNELRPQTIPQELLGVQARLINVQRV
jgi:hypothetical protein